MNYDPETHGPDMIEQMEVGGRIYTLRPYTPKHRGATAGHGWLREVAPGRRSEIGAEGVALLDEIARLRSRLAERPTVDELVSRGADIVRNVEVKHSARCRTPEPHSTMDCSDSPLIVRWWT